MGERSPEPRVKRDARATTLWGVKRVRFRRVGLWLAGLALGLVVFAGAPARAATLTVNSAADDTTAMDGFVTLREAILAAESDGTTDLAETGSGADSIVFDAALTATGDATITLTTVGDTQFGPSAFVVTTPITIQGPSGGRGITLARGVVTKLRHFAVTSTGSLTLENLVLTNGRAIGGNGGTNLGDDGGGGGGGAGLGGAIYSQGALEVRGSTLFGNRAQGGSGGPGADNVGADVGGGGGGGGLGGNGGSMPDGNGSTEGGGGGGGTLGNGGIPSVGGSGGGGGGGTQTDGSNGSGATGGAGGTLNGGAGGNGVSTAGGDATGPGGGGGGGGDERNGGAGGFGGGGGGSGENDSGVDHPAGAGGYGGGGGGGGEDDSGGRGGFGGGGGGGNEDGLGGPALSAAGGFGAGNGGNFGAALLGSAGGGGGGGFGGAIFNHNGTLTLTNATLSSNSAVGGSGGGGAFTGGNGEALGGGVFNLNGTVTVQNATFSGNTAGRGIDVFNLAHETTAGVAPADATLALTNTILDSSAVETVENAQLGADPGSAIVNGDATDLLLGGVVNNGGTVNDGGIVIGSALLGSLFDNGGPTLTHAPQFPGSPAIDASTSGAATDQRGVARPSGARFDIGAVEVPQFTGVLAPGDLLYSEGSRGSVVDIQGGGDFLLAPRFAYGLDMPYGLCTGPGGEVYAAEFTSGEVTVITAGGDFSAAPAFASGLSSPIELLCTDSQILVGEFSSGEVTDITAGGDFSAAAPFASGLGSVLGLLRDSGGTLWAVRQGGIVHDITAGGDFSADAGFVTGGADLRGIAERGTTLLVAQEDTGEVLDYSAGGAVNTLPVFAMVPAPTQLVDYGPLGLFVASNYDGGVYEISAGGDFTAATPFATGIDNGGGFAEIELVEGCGDGLLDAATEECDDANVIDGCSATCTLRCEPAPELMCNAAAAASVKLDERKPGKEKLKASLKKFAGGADLGDFGDPVADDTRFALCLYDASDALVLDLRVDRAGELCGPKQKPCWKALGTKGFGYKDPLAEAEGATKLTARSGAAGKGSLALQGKNNTPKGLTDLPTGAAALLAGETSATLQMLASDGACFSADLTTVKKAEGGRFQAKAP
jgi:hypothetical protein